MSKVRLVVTTIKPEGIPWYKDIAPGRIRLLNIWVRNYPGLTLLSGHEVNPTTWEAIYEFIDRAAYDAFTEDHNKHGIRNERLAYNDTNGITTTSEIVELP